jgi:hypothetical protein
MATTDAEVALAWLALDAEERPALWFGRLSPALDLIGANQIPDDRVAAGELYNLYSMSVGVARLASGWAVAGWSEPELFIHALDSGGRPLARTRIATGLTSYTLFSRPILVSRPDGAPLLFWQTDHQLHVVVVADDGRSASTPVSVALDDDGFIADATFVDGAFYALFDASPPKPGVRIRRFSPNGALTATFDALAGVNQLNPVLVNGADDLRVAFVTWTTDSYEPPVIVTQKLSSSGASLGPPGVVGGYAEGYVAVQATAFDGDTLSLLIGDALGVSRLGQNGTLVTPPYRIKGDEPADWFSIRRRGPDAIAAWHGGPQGGLRVARIRP